MQLSENKETKISLFARGKRKDRRMRSLNGHRQLLEGESVRKGRPVSSRAAALRLKRELLEPVAGRNPRLNREFMEQSTACIPNANNTTSSRFELRQKMQDKTENESRTRVCKFSGRPQLRANAAGNDLRRLYFCPCNLSKKSSSDGAVLRRTGRSIAKSSGRCFRR